MTAAAPESPVSPRAHHLPAAGLAVVVTALVAGSPLVLDGTGRIVAVAVLQAALVASWVRATGVQGTAGALLIGAAAAGAADVVLLLPERPELDALAAVLGLGLLAAVVHQMTRPAPRSQLVASLAGVVLLLCAVCALAVLLVVGRLDGGPRAVTGTAVVVGVALVVGHLVDLVLPRPAVAPGVPCGPAALVLAVLAGAGTAVLLGDRGSLEEAVAVVTFGVAIGAVAALTSLGASYVVVERAESGWAMAVVQAVLPLAAAAPVAYALTLNGIG
jgi:hypothetical protein